MKINYEEFYGNHPYHPPMNYEIPTVSIFFYERKRLFVREFKRLKKRLKSIRVLDVGCGYGPSIFSLSKISRKDDSLLGIDINSNSIRYSKNYAEDRKINNVDFKIIDLSKQDWADDLNKEFDLIIFSETIEHLYPKDQDNALKNISKVLSKEGILIITCPNKNCIVKKAINFSKKLPFIGKKIKIELLGSEGHVAEPSYPELRKKSSRHFYKVRQGGLTFTYGNEFLDNNNFLTMLTIFLNISFRIFFPFWCFDQYIILRKRQPKSKDISFITPYFLETNNPK